MEENYVPLTTASGPFQKFAIEESLKAADIPYTIREQGGPTAIIGSSTPLISQEFLVPPERLQEAKDTLCASGIVCEVSERLLRRAIEEIVKPLFGASNPDLSRLTHFIEVNNKETVKALLEAVLEEDGGLALLENVFFRLDHTEDVPSLRTLARVLGPKAGQHFLERLRNVMATGKTEERLAVLEIIPELPDSTARAHVLAMGLRDPDFQVREAGGEALFALGKGDFGYEPDAPEDEREAAIADFLTLHG
jgi:hypothetical protein